MLVGIAFIGAAAAGNEDIDEDELETGGRSRVVNGMLALTIGFCGPCCISFQHFFIRKFGPQYPGIEQAMDSIAPRMLIFSCFLFQLRNDMVITWSDILTGSIAGFLMETSRILIAYGIAKGLAGPA